jgi:hypothetical protein
VELGGGGQIKLRKKNDPESARKARAGLDTDDEKKFADFRWLKYYFSHLRASLFGQ